jgi:hypothetical protein
VKSHDSLLSIYFSSYIQAIGGISGAGIATGWTAGVRFPAGARDFSLLHSIHTASGAHPASYPMGTGGSFAGCKAAGA